MRKLVALAVAGVLFCGVGLLRADDKDKEITLKGEGMCAKCALQETKTCQNAVIVTKDGVQKTYYIVHDDVAKKVHQRLGFCRATKEKPAKVKITGTCEEKDGKLVFTAKKIEKDEEG
jgi:uncharacterized protein DUF6370